MQPSNLPREDDEVDKPAPAIDVLEVGVSGSTNEYGDEIDPTYKTKSTFDRFRRGVFLQMILFGA